MSQVVSLNLACPFCDKQKEERTLKTSPGRFGYFCDAGHIINDTEQLNLLSPRPMKPIAAPAGPTKAPPPGFKRLEAVIPDKLAEALTARFGEKLAPTLGALLGALLDPDAFVVQGLDANRLSELLATKVTHSQQLVGAVRTMRGEVVQGQQEVAAAKAAAANRAPATVPGAIMLSLPSEVVARLADTASAAGSSVGEYLAAQIPLCVQNNSL